jgi:tetratricopeptide (TPR) repeat protein
MARHTKKRVAAGTVVVLLVLSQARSADALDRIERKSTSTPAQGDVTDVSRTAVTVTSRTKPAEQIPANDIVSIRWDGEPAALNLHRNDEAGGRLDRALTGYTAVLQEVDQTKRNLRADVEFLIARTVAKLALADPAKLEEAAQKLDAFRTANPTSYRYFEALDYLGRVRVAQNDTEKANAVFQLLGEAPWPEYQMSGKLAAAEMRLSAGQVDEALADYESVLKTSNEGAAGQEQRRQATLGKAAALSKKQQHDEAAKLIESLIYDLPLDNTQLQAKSYMRLGEVRDAQGKTKEAVLAYLHVDVLFPSEKPLHAESLYHLARLWACLG